MRTYIFLFIIVIGLISLSIFNFGHLINASLISNKKSILKSVLVLILFNLVILELNIHNIICKILLFVLFIALLIYAKKELLVLLIGLLFLSFWSLFYIVLSNNIDLIPINLFNYLIFLLVTNILIYALKSKFHNLNIYLNHIQILNKFNKHILFSLLFVVAIYLFVFKSLKELIVILKIPGVNLFFILLMMIFVLIFINFILLLSSNSRKNNLNTQNENTNRFINSLRASRHEYNSNLNIISQLLSSRQYLKLKKYMESLTSESNLINNVSGLKFPEISAILYRFKKMAEEDEILFDTSFDNNLANISISIYDLNIILTNVLSNAFISAKKDSGFVNLNFSIKNNYYIINILNTGNIPEEILKHIGTPGVTSKENEQYNHGFGMFLVKNIVKKNKGFITINNSNQNTVKTTIKIPMKENILNK